MPNKSTKALIFFKKRSIIISFVTSSHYGSSINDVTALGGECQGFDDDNQKILLLNNMTVWNGGQILRDVIYGWTLTVFYYFTTARTIDFKLFGQ